MPPHPTPTPSPRVPDCVGVRAATASTLSVVWSAPVPATATRPYRLELTETFNDTGWRLSLIHI